MAIHIRRREFVFILGGAVAAWPLATRAQQPAMPLIGILSSTSAAPYKHLVEAIFRGLREQGFDFGRNAAVEQRWADGQYDRLPGFASELTSLPAKVIIAIAPPAARAAKAATSSIPIIFSTAGDPVALGLVSSLNRPGGNLTGISLMLFAMAGKRLELLTKLTPSVNTIGMLINPNNPSSPVSVADAQAAAKTLDLKLILAHAGTSREIDAAFAHFVEQRAGAISVEADPFLLARREQLAAQAARYSLPTIYPHRENAEVGGLISYGTDLIDAYRQIGIYAGRVLKGEQPADLPVMQVSKFELLINMKTAKTLGLEIPPNLLALADEVIE
jgi:putative tryptophan/tyrosine transport system substrate-binding protein